MLQPELESLSREALEPLVLERMRATLARVRENTAYAKRLGDVTPGDLRGLGFHYGAERLGAMVVPTGAGRTSLQLRLLRDLGVTVLPAIATYPLRMIEVAREEGFDLRSLSLRVGILGSEMWSDELRARIERELSIRTFDIIGMTETGGPGLGIDCVARRGIHVLEDHYHPEVIDPATGRVVPD